MVVHVSNFAYFDFMCTSASEKMFFITIIKCVLKMNIPIDHKINIFSEVVQKQYFQVDERDMGKLSFQ